AVGLASEIRKVTVYSDRALVTREATTQPVNEPTVYVFKELPGWVDESSVRVAASGGRILDVRVSRSYLARSTERSRRRAEAELRELQSRLAALDDELKVLDTQAKQIEDIKAFSADKLDKDVITGNVGVTTYAAVVGFVSKSLRETAKGRRAVHSEREQLLPELEASKRRLDRLRGLTQLEQTQVFVTLAATGSAPSSGRLSLSYLLPGATWETLHELRASEGDLTSVEVTSFAVVTQASGEDWSNAELTFSTRSTSAAVRIPELEALTLGDTRAATETIERQSASFTRAEAAFKAQNQLWNRRAQSTELSRNFEEVYQSNLDYLQVVQSKTVQIFESLQQRGTTAQFKALSASNVHADGRSVRVPIGGVHLKAKQAIVAAPEQSLNAAQTLEMQNESGQALLPGNVALYQAGAFLGMTNLDFVADGEQFAVFLGVADQLKLSRTLDKKHSALVRKQRTQMQLAFIVTVENLSPKAVTLNLADRIPISEDKEIVISGVKVSPDVKPDSKGILSWPLTLQPRERRKFEIQYQIEYPPSLVLELNREKAQQAPTSVSPSRAAAPSAYDLKRDIQQLEDSF
ncbi:MAG: mucoidy inhibitor MuiA family protein, partial [Polyangiaceae bacterium]